MSQSKSLQGTIRHPQWGWRLDVSATPLETQIPAPWVHAFQEMADIESGKRVNHSEQQQVGHFWIRAPEHAPTMGQAAEIGNTLEELIDWVNAARNGEILLEQAHPITDVIHVGLGGSSLGAQLLVTATSTPRTCRS